MTPMDWVLVNAAGIAVFCWIATSAWIWWDKRHPPKS
jgi:hypothetical protein